MKRLRNDSIQKNRIIAERYQEVKVIIVDSICLLPFHV